ncbi:hypothetical protein MKHDV_03381 [Halodesulfovibrio sp. MK-HDV]|nr:hypothetical protein MKHDV_03381 [Halodesulfovibrio sp. MK-HDV]
MLNTKKTPKAKSLAEWLTSQDWSSSIGGRKFQDNKGETHFIGIGAAALGTSSTSRKAGRGIAEMMARKEVATALFANVAAYERADLAQKTYNMNGKDESIALQSYASTLKQSFENRQISGLGKVYGKELIHPISGQKMYVAIFDLTSESARQAMKMEKSNYLSRIMDVVDQKRKKTTKAGYVESVKQAKKMSARSAKTSTSSSAVAPAKGQKNVYRNKSAVQGGAGSDSFDW